MVLMSKKDHRNTCPNDCQCCSVSRWMFADSNFAVAQIWPMYRVEWWHLGSPLLFPRVRPQASRSNAVYQPRTNQIKQNWSTSSESTTSLPKKAHIWSGIFQPYLLFYMLCCFRLRSILQRCIIAWSGPSLYAIWESFNMSEMCVYQLVVEFLCNQLAKTRAGTIIRLIH